MSEFTLHFDNAREASDLTDLPAKTLAEIERLFNVSLTARDTWLTIDGSGADDAVRFFQELRTARERSVPLNSALIDHALKAFIDGREEVLRTFASMRIDVSPRKDPVFPRTLGQQIYLDAIRNHAVTFGLGPAGTGKTYLAMATAISALLNDEVSQIILTRPAIEAGEALGFLPGDLQQKIDPYLRPLYDALNDMLPAADIEKLMERGVIEVAPLAYMRGRTLNHAFVILDEAQNTTTKQMMMLLTRLGFDAKAVITGDPTQIDLPDRKNSGLLEAEAILQHIDDLAFVELTDDDVIRHPLVQEIIRAYRRHRA
ncbi:MAG: PhoH family protein [Kiritimatiellales bacterium]|nr:PhoH family protein [Kiritimatiellota bacterium]MBL7011622.1 PhoH family protein [Kiritimatiellales bacterium]